MFNEFFHERLKPRNNGPVKKPNNNTELREEPSTESWYAMEGRLAGGKDMILADKELRFNKFIRSQFCLKIQGLVI